MINGPEAALRTADARIAWVLGHAQMSPWLKGALQTALDGDPVELGNDVEVLRQLLQTRAEVWVQCRR